MADPAPNVRVFLILNFLLSGRQLANLSFFLQVSEDDGVFFSLCMMC